MGTTGQNKRRPETQRHLAGYFAAEFLCAVALRGHLSAVVQLSAWQADRLQNIVPHGDQISSVVHRQWSICE